MMVELAGCPLACMHAHLLSSMEHSIVFKVSVAVVNPYVILTRRHLIPRQLPGTAADKESIQICRMPEHHLRHFGGC